MEQRHKRSSFKHSDSRYKTSGNRSMLSSNRESGSNTDTQGSTDSQFSEQPQNNAKSKSKGIRGFLKLLPFWRANKTQSVAKKPKKAQIQKRYDIPLTVEEVRKIISQYAKYENLYNPKNAQYGNKHIEKIYYSDIARIIPNKSGSQIQALLQDLRLQFEREYAIIENSRRSYGEILMPSIDYYNEFLFLVPFLGLYDSDSQSRRSEQVESADLSAASISSSRTSAGKSQDGMHSSRRDITSLMRQSLPLPTPTSMPVPVNECLPRRSARISYERKDSPSDIITSKPEKEKEPKVKESRKVHIKEESEQLDSVKEKPQQDTSEQQLALNQKAKQQQAQDRRQSEQQVELNQKPANIEQQQVQEQAEVPEVQNQKVASQLEPKPQAEPIGVKPAQGQPQIVANDNQYPANSRPPNNQCPVECNGNQRRNYVALIHVGAPAAQGPPKAVINQPGPRPRPDSRFQGAANFQSGPQSNAGPRQSPRFAAPLAARAAQESPRDSATTNNGQQVQMLCDMIRTELSSAPDFIYYDAKWRIIEILKEVNKRQMIHAKSAPAKCVCRPKEPEVKANNACGEGSQRTKSGFARMCDQVKAAHCPYCPNSCKR